MTSIRVGFFQCFPVVPKEQAERGGQIECFNVFEGHPMQLHGVACRLCRSVFHMHKIINNHVMVLDFTLLIKVNVADDIN